ncbi:hypothetical protein FOCC_FOCC006200 [Frankliniella occidentalis]|nr:hypothetical protein FOCC_FOCC006200 [Frankliniella occidentalis]
MPRRVPFALIFTSDPPAADVVRRDRIVQGPFEKGAECRFQWADPKLQPKKDKDKNKPKPPPVTVELQGRIIETGTKVGLEKLHVSEYAEIVENGGVGTRAQEQARLKTLQNNAEINQLQNIAEQLVNGGPGLGNVPEGPSCLQTPYPKKSRDEEKNKTAVVSVSCKEVYMNTGKLARIRRDFRQDPRVLALVTYKRAGGDPETVTFSTQEQIGSSIGNGRRYIKAGNDISSDEDLDEEAVEVSDNEAEGVGPHIQAQVMQLFVEDQAAGQDPPGQETPNQETPPGQETPNQETPPGQETPNQETPPGEEPTGQLPSAQVLPGQLPSAHLPPGQEPLGQVPSGQLPSAQVLPGQLSSAQLFPGQVPPGQLRPEQLFNGQVTPDQLLPRELPHELQLFGEPLEPGEQLPLQYHSDVNMNTLKPDGGFTGLNWGQGSVPSTSLSSVIGQNLRPFYEGSTGM